MLYRGNVGGSLLFVIMVALYLIPSALGEDCDVLSLFSSHVKDIIRRLDGFFAENAKPARAFLKSAGINKPLYEVPIHEYSRRKRRLDVDELLDFIVQGQSWGLLSDAGCPAIADPGSDIVRRAHALGIRVIPLVGPSSILLALMASGLNGQSFTFHGYLPVKPHDRKRALIRLEKDSRKQGTTQIFMETPYRNPHLLRDILASLSSCTELCIATDITLSSENICTRAIEDWHKRGVPNIHKRPTIFLIYAGE